MQTEEDLSYFKNYLTFYENYPKTAKTLAYGITLVSLVATTCYTKALTKFQKPSDIPTRFLRKKVKLSGTIVRVQPSSGGLLMVDHKPLVPLLRLYNIKHLPVKLAGLDITSNGINWLQLIAVGKQVTFVPLTIEENYVNCIVTVQHNKEHINICQELAKLGFAVTSGNAFKNKTEDKDVLSYAKSVLKAEKWAQRKRNGYWQFAIHPTLLWKIEEQLTKMLKSLLNQRSA